MSSSGKKRERSSNAEEGSMDSTAKSRYALKVESVASNSLRLPNEWIPPRVEIMNRKGKGLESSESLANKESYGAAPVSREEFERQQQAWKNKKQKDFEEDPEEDLSICSDQRNEDPKDT
ncbi:Uncharacterized protein TCM_018266 [Theobroma cacao]|uniref:Uncharacterized protein n=1 Tax=Theobroma cacao TaxID=3641 RepID=A0A061ELZ9_THECC|nr:Uncharacterized protein TCM_018266 [Theobroma cacao]